jgi:preprotein translocase subunit SecE
MLLARQVIAELRKVAKPTRTELFRYTVIVLMFVAVMILLLDLCFGALFALLFKGNSIGDN